MSEENALAEISGVARREEVPVAPEPEWYKCRFDRELKEGEEPKWWEAFGCVDLHEAAEAFARFADAGNPRPPLKRTVVVALPRGGTRFVEITVKPSLSYESNGL